MVADVGRDSPAPPTPSVRFRAGDPNAAPLSPALARAQHRRDQNHCGMQGLGIVNAWEYTSPVLTEVARNIWIADGPCVPFFGFPYPTRMTVVRLCDRSLWVWSPIQLTEQLKATLNQQGPVRHLVSPNKIHHLYLGEWLQAWPDAKLYASPGLARRCRDLSFSAKLGDAPDPAWCADIDQVIVRGSFIMDEVVLFHCGSRTAIVADLVQRFDRATLHGWRRMLMTLDGVTGVHGSTPREWRLSFWNRAAARRAMRKILDWNPERVVIAHGEWVRANGREVLERALAWMG
jgi:Domain of unknown function (DUF4336)